jgi:hypothetical protein
MGNKARYWFLGNAVLTKKARDELLSFGFTEYKNKGCDMNWCFDDEKITDDVYRLKFLYVEHDQIMWKQEFDLWCYHNNIKVERWQEY